MDLSNTPVLDYILAICLIFAGIFYVQKTQRRNATSLTVIGVACCLACAGSLLVSLRGAEVDTRQLFVGLGVLSFIVYHVAPFIYLTTGLLDSVSRLIRSRSDNRLVDRDGLIGVINNVASVVSRPRPGGLRSQFSKRVAQLRPDRVYILTSEVGSVRHTESGKGLANNWLFKGNAAFQHWTVMVDGMCYELGRLKNIKDGPSDAYGVRTETVEQWQVRRSIKSFGMTVMIGKFDAGYTRLDKSQIETAARNIWQAEFKGTYVLTRQNCQNFADKLLKRIRIHNPDTWGTPPMMLSKTYLRATRPVRIPWYITKYSIMAAGLPFWLGYQALYELSGHSNVHPLKQENKQGDASQKNVRAAVSVEESTACLLEEEEVLDQENIPLARMEES